MTLRDLTTLAADLRGFNSGIARARMAYAAEMARAETPTPTPRKPAKCGTASGHNRHKRNGEQPCEACIEGSRRYSRERWHRRQALKKEQSK